MKTAWAGKNISFPVFEQMRKYSEIFFGKICARKLRNSTDILLQVKFVVSKFRLVHAIQLFRKLNYRSQLCLICHNCLNLF
jgi:hypothetical protein